MKLWVMAWRNLRLHRRRSLITGGAITFGFTGVLLLGGYMLRMEDYLSTRGIYLSHVGHLSIYKKDGLDRHLTDPENYNLSQQDQENIINTVKSLSRPVALVARYLRGQGLVTNGCNSYPFFLTAVDPQAEAWVRTHHQTRKWTPELLRLKRGFGFWQEAQGTDHILVAYRLAKLLHKDLVAGDPGEDISTADTLITDCAKPETKELINSNAGVQLLGSSFAGGLAAAEARIGGHFSTGMALADDSAIMAPLELAQQFYRTDQVTWISIFLNEGDPVVARAREIERLFQKNGWSYEVYTYRSARVNPYYVGAMNFVYVMMILFLVLVCGVVALSILNSLQISLMERKVELGTLRAIGFRPRMVVSLFVRETILLSLISLLVGTLLAFSIAAFINYLNIRFPLVGSADHIQFMLTPNLLLTVVTAAIFLIVATLTCYSECQRRMRAKVITLLEQA